MNETWNPIATAPKSGGELSPGAGHFGPWIEVRLGERQAVVRWWAPPTTSDTLTVGHWQALEGARLTFEPREWREPREADVTDPDNPLLTPEDFARMQSPEEVLPPEVLAQFRSRSKRGAP